MPRAVFREQDPFAPLQYSYPGVRELHREDSPYQRIQVLQHPFFGRMLALDGVVQLTERDEFFYHEMLVHVPMAVHPSPRRVLIVGGGDGGKPAGGRSSTARWSPPRWWRSTPRSSRSPSGSSPP